MSRKMNSIRSSGSSTPRSGEYLDTRTEPLIFCGVDYLFPIYRRHNHYPRLATQHVAGNPDLATSRELRERAWPIVEALLRERQDDAIARYWEFVSSGRCRNRLEEIFNRGARGSGGNPIYQSDAPTVGGSISTQDHKQCA